MCKRKQSGSSMVEVLVTLVVIATGLLGIASMQMVSMKNANSSYQRYVASLYAYDMMERMRSNPAGVNAGQYNNITANGSGTATACDNNNVCSSAQMAAWDAWKWGNQISDKLPNGVGTVAVGSDGYVITVSWSEQDTGAGLGTTAGAADTQTFTLEVAL